MINYFKQMTKSIIDKGFGEEIKKEKVSVAVKYFFIFMLIIGSALITKFNIGLDKLSKESISDIKTEFSDFELKGGKFIYYGEMPVIKKENDIAVIIDTSGNTTEEVLNSYEAGVFITETKILIKKNKFENSVYNLSDFKGMDFTKKQMIESVESFKTPLMIGIFIFGMILIYIGKIIGILVLSLVAIIISKNLRIKMDYSEIFKVTVYAITLPTIIKFIIIMSGTKFNLFFIIYYTIAIFYLMRYIKMYKESN